jgi:selenocysteine-specific elongation factor
LVRCGDALEFSNDFLRSVVVIVATAGHIDHGKTSLVRALTGVDTDRLPEEKKRGISIDIGFAYLPLQGAGNAGGVIGFVDVPGHERFVRNMIAGVCGIDFALIVVAADDGIMPQTIEHVQILELLGIRSGLVAVTKSDRAEPARLAEVAAQTQALLVGGSLEGIPWLPVSATTGAGISTLREALNAAALRSATRYQESGYFRFAIDRAFTVKGSGTVVTGTAFDGRVSLGEHLVLAPRGTEVRVRQIQIHGRDATSAAAGERCALNLSGVSVAEVGRGDWVLAAALNRPSRRIAVRCTLLRSSAPLAHWTQVDAHLGTARVRARIATTAGQPVMPGETRVLQLVFERDVTSVHGDRFILRDTSARHSLGGGVVLDPFAPATGRMAPAHRAYLAALQENEPRAALEKLLAIPLQATDLSRFAATFNLHAGHCERLCRELKADIIGRDRAAHACTPATVIAVGAAVNAALVEFHRDAPSTAVLEIGKLRRAAAPQLGAPAFLALLQSLAAQGKLEITNTNVRLVHLGEAADSADDAIWDRLRIVLRNGGLTPPAIEKVAQELRVPATALKSLLFRRRATGEVMRIAGDRYYPRATMAMLAATADMLAKSSPAGFSVAQFRDATGIPRDTCVPILEFLDSLIITRRIGDLRKIIKDRIPILGDSAPVPVPAVLPTGSLPRPGNKKFERRW